MQSPATPMRDASVERIEMNKMIEVIGNMTSYHVKIQYMTTHWMVQIESDNAIDNRIMIPITIGFRKAITTIYQTIGDIDWYKYQAEHMPVPSERMA